MENHLTTPDNIKQNTRPVSSNLDNNRIEIYIEEAEQINIKPRIGDALFIDLLEYVLSEDKTAFPAEYETLLNGGEYLTTLCGETRKKTFKGLLSALNYYVYARLVKHNDSNVTRFGFVQKDDEYSSRHDLKIKLAEEKDALTVADIYIADCIQYLKANAKNIPLFTVPGKVKNRLNITMIGD
ncbi:MAG: hypothetical protein LBP72_08070 [Dysgonamonadaceae bacterium]|jgi:hypothetical protein|nr:hypothetical protein [Dysgonamonadaceae bacterium]